jgi:hypothetical protein
MFTVHLQLVWCRVWCLDISGVTHFKTKRFVMMLSTCYFMNARALEFHTITAISASVTRPDSTATTYVLNIAARLQNALYTIYLL